MPLARWVVALLLALSVHSAAATSTFRYPRRVLLDSDALATLLHDARAEPFRDDRIAILRRYSLGYWFDPDEIAMIVPIFEWREDRLRALALMAPWLTDRTRASSLLPLFPDDRRRAAELLGIAP